MNTGTRAGSAASVVLISPADGGLTSNGTGFVVEQIGDTALVLTCSHVIGHDITAKVLVNGLPPTKITSAISRGLDLALLEVKGLTAPALGIRSLSFSDQLMSYYGFSKLYLDDYMRTRLDSRLLRPLDLQRAGAAQSYLAYEFISVSDGAVQSGHSGAPMIVDGAATAIVSHRLGEGQKGLAIALAAALRDWPEAAHLVGQEPLPDLDPAEPARPKPGARGKAAKPSPSVEPRFETLPSPTTVDPDDDNAQRFGPSESDGLRLRAEFKDVASGRSFFVCDLVVEAVGDAPFDVEAVRFVLHSTFNPRMYVQRPRVSRPDQVRLEDITSYGVFTAGAQVRRTDGRFTLLGYDLAQLPGLPKEFLDL